MKHLQKYSLLIHRSTIILAASAERYSDFITEHSCKPIYGEILMRLIKIISLPLLLAFAGNLAAETDKTSSDSATKAKQANRMTCEEFLALDEVYRPKVIYWTAGKVKKGNTEDINVLISGTEKLVPEIIEECKKNPKESFWQRVKSHF
ncbi:putative acid stress chaperone HdeA precursor [Legionella massiliensis]|uniref:Putative acid stress chaperone HdeA n=1 Tax=Legionella massiliensis TaxID=1034943 RepID=A0A078KT16_9GAMM|nr:HdeA/HdeB family chaperone [Legionella massiliensis]CDZ76206.1 putative acid stress chaperone HdeA precursor [Legionella massiliensis]CEE11944.1 putative acid stress chaperone HdeA precursor [Legionella massiliensis]